MEDLSPEVNGNASEYQPMGSCESDDSRSNASRSDDNEGVPGIIYTSDDSADVGQSDSTYVDSDAPHYYAQNVNEAIEDQISQQCLLASNSPTPSLSTGASSLISHPLSPMNLNRANSKECRIPSQNKNKLFVDHPKIHLEVNSDGLGLMRCNSTSSSSTEPEFTQEAPFLSEYEPLSCYPDDEGYAGGLNFEAMKDDPIKTQVIAGKVLVGGVFIDSKYKDAFYVKWNWGKIRQSCIFVNLSMMVALFCISIGLLMHGLGVKNVRLGCIFESTVNSPMHDYSFLPSNYSTVSKTLGDEEDLQLLAALLHERNMFLILDFPLISPFEEKQTGLNNSNSAPLSPVMDLVMDVPLVLYKWTELGVDGFVFTDIHRLSHVDQLNNAMHSWRSVLDRKNRRPHRRVMSVPVELLKELESKASLDLSPILNDVDLIDVYLNVNQSAEQISKDIDEATKWDSHVSNPWINWYFGGIGHKRLSTLLSTFDQFNSSKETRFSPTLGASIFQLFLPGSVTLFYADEINAQEVDDPSLEDASWASIMHWTPNSAHGGFSSETPWLSSMRDWTSWNVASINQSMDSLRSMVRDSQTKVPLYINGIFDDVGDYHPKKTNNYKIKRALDNLFIMDRFYPRRNRYTIVMNFGPESVTKDLSKLYYGGSVLASSHGKTGYIRFQEITLQPGEALACIMDK